MKNIVRDIIKIVLNLTYIHVCVCFFTRNIRNYNQFQLYSKYDSSKFLLLWSNNDFCKN